jgi:hypothetical protein
MSECFKHSIFLLLFIEKFHNMLKNLLFFIIIKCFCNVETIKFNTVAVYFVFVFKIIILLNFLKLWAFIVTKQCALTCYD